MMTIGERITRFWQRRGHGVHSPFVYELVRYLYQRRAETPTEISNTLTNKGINPHIALQLEQVITHCLYSNWGIDKVDYIDDLELLICHSLSDIEIDSVVERARESGSTVAIIAPSSGEYIVNNHPSTSIQARGYTLLFNNGLPKQNFKI